VHPYTHEVSKVATRRRGFTALVFWCCAAPLILSQAPSYRIVVVEGEDAVNIVQQRTATTPVIEVRDHNNLPVAGVPVTFAIQGSGTGVFSGGLSTVTVTTNAAGRAAASAITPLTGGGMQIQVTAAVQSQTLATTITQTNVLTITEAVGASAPTSTSAAGSSGGGAAQTALVTAAGAGAVGAAVVAVTGGHSAPSPAPIAVQVAPTGLGLRDVTVFTFTAQTGDLTNPTVTWNFGDGATATGQVVSHVFGRTGDFTVGVHVNDRSSAANLKVGSLDGLWTTGVSAEGIEMRFTVMQQGSSLSGQWVITYSQNAPGHPPAGTIVVSPLSGTLKSPREFQINELGACFRVFTGAVDETLTTLSGTAPASGSCLGGPMSLKKIS